MKMKLINAVIIGLFYATSFFEHLLKTENRGFSMFPEGL